MSQNKFVSSLPQNKLEPVFLGGGSGPSSKSSGTYVPVFMQNQPEKDKSNVTNPRVANKEFKMSENDFPSISFAKSSSVTIRTYANTTTGPSKIFTNYSDALKKDIDKPQHKSSQQNSKNDVKNIETKSKQTRIIDDYSDYDSDEYFMDDEPF